MHTDGFHCRESAGTGLVVLKVVPVTDTAFSGITMEQFSYAFFFYTHYHWYNICLDLTYGR